MGLSKVCTCTCVFRFRRDSRCLFLQTVYATLCKRILFKMRHVKMCESVNAENYNANIYSVHWAAYSYIFQSNSYLYGLKYAWTVQPTFEYGTWGTCSNPQRFGRLSRVFSPSRPALQLSRLSLHPAWLAPLPGEPLNPGEEHIVSTCLSAHARWQREKKKPRPGAAVCLLW